MTSSADAGAASQKFLWGVATASYQVEGGITNNDWEFFTRSGPIRDRVYRITGIRLFTHDFQLQLQPARDGVKFWDPAYYNKYFDIAKSLGMNCFRIGIDWARIEPQRNVWDNSAINQYKQMILAMKQKGLTPVVTLCHFTLPSWVLTPPTRFQSIFSKIPQPYNSIPLFGVPPKDDPYWQSLQGWENEHTVNEFVTYVSKVVPALKDQVDYWLTLNEPVGSVIGVGYVAGFWSPGFFLDGDRAKKVLHNQIEAHVRAYNTIKSINANAKIGFAHNMSIAAAAAPGQILGVTFPTGADNQRAAQNYDYYINDYFLNAVVNGEEDLNYLESLQRHNTSSPNFIIHNDWRNKVDFIGLNYYRRFYVVNGDIIFDILPSTKFIGGIPINNLIGSNQPHGLLNDLGWEIYPQGIHDILVKIKNQWNKPVLISENGIPDKSDKYRAQFIVAHLQQVKKAIDEGVNVLGYIYWSIMDNFEWADNYRDEAKFGLYSIDRSGREMISETKEHWGFPGFGGKGNDTINAGRMLPSSSCVIDDVILELLDKQGKILSTTNRGQPDAVNDPFYILPNTQGARIVRSYEGTSNLEAEVHWWFDAGTAVRYRLHYYFRGNNCNNDGQPDFSARQTKGAQALQTVITESRGGTITDSSLATAVSKFGTITSDGTNIVLPPTPHLLTKVQPYPIKFPSTQMQVTSTFSVHAEDSNTHLTVSGRVIIDGQDRGGTDASITYTFHKKRVREAVDPDLKKGGGTFDVTYSYGKVSAGGYPDTPIDFGFEG